MKGLERDAVIVVTADDDLGDHLLYVGMSRAVSRLVVVGPRALTTRLQAGGPGIRVPRMILRAFRPRSPCPATGDGSGAVEQLPCGGG